MTGTGPPLPRPLQPWHHWLDWFNAELAEVMGDLVRRLSDLAGPAQAASGRQQTEPDGLGDLRTRGSYERLLGSEWLLADELPLEFLRRAASAEHLFLAPSLRAIPSERHVVAIFDAGPRQLGAPRVAHLAAWILLARRAEQLGGTLRWGLLHQPGVLLEVKGMDALFKLLKARVLSADDAGHPSRWRQALAEQASPEAPDHARSAARMAAHASAGASVHPAPHQAHKQADNQAEIWWIGAPPSADTAPLPRNERRLELGLSWAGPALQAAVVTPQGRRAARLPLPTDTQIGALLRGNFAKALPAMGPTPKGTTSERLSLTRRPVIAPDGSHVAAFTLEGHSALVVKRRWDTRTPSIREQRWSSHRPLVAATLNGGQMIGLGLNSEQISFWQMEGWRPRQRPSSDDFPVAVATAAAMPMAWLRDGHGQRLFVVDERKRLQAWDWRNKTVTGPKAVQRQVLAMVPTGESITYAYHDKGTLWLQTAHIQDQPAPAPVSLMPLADEQAPVFLGVAIGRSGLHLTALATRIRKQPHQQWMLVLEGHVTSDRLIDIQHAVRQAVTVEIPRQARVVGLVYTGLAGERVARLVVLSPDRRSLSQMPSPDGRPLFATAGTIAQAVVCPRSGRVAIITDDRSLHVIEGRTGDTVLTVAGAEPPARAPQDQDNSDIEDTEDTGDMPA